MSFSRSRVTTSHSGAILEGGTAFQASNSSLPFCYERERPLLKLRPASPTHGPMLSEVTATRTRPYYALPHWDESVIEGSDRERVECSLGGYKASASGGASPCLRLVLFPLPPPQLFRRCIPHRLGHPLLPRHRSLRKLNPGVFTSLTRRRSRHLRNRTKTLYHPRLTPGSSDCLGSPTTEHPRSIHGYR